MSLVGEELGQGGEGVVWAVPDYARLMDAFQLRIGQTVGRGPWVYKGYTIVPDWDRLVGLVNWFAALPRNKENLLLATTVWPQMVLAETAGPDGRPGPGAIGIVMPRLGDEYFMTLSSLGHTIKKYRAIDYLTWNEVQASKVTGFQYPTLRQRLGVLRAIATTLGILHEHGLAYGDLNPNNVVLGPNWDDPRICFVDCDSIRTGSSVIDGAAVNAPGWEPPEGGVDQRTDCYKFAMLALRCLGCSNDMAGLVGATRRRELGVTDRLSQMLLAGLDPDPTQRPSIFDFEQALAAEADLTVPTKMPWALPVPMEHREDALVHDDEPQAEELAEALHVPPARPLAPAPAPAAPSPTYAPAKGSELHATPLATAAVKPVKRDPKLVAKERAAATRKAKKQKAKAQAKRANQGRTGRLLAAAVVLLLVGGGAAYFLTKSDEPATSAKPAATSAPSTTLDPAAVPPTPDPCREAFEAYVATPQDSLKFATIQRCATETDWLVNNTANPIGEALDPLCARRNGLPAAVCVDADARRAGGG